MTLTLLPHSAGLLLEADDGAVAVPLYIPLTPDSARELAHRLLFMAGAAERACVPVSPETLFDND